MEELLGGKLLVSVAEEASPFLPTTAAGKAHIHTHTEIHKHIVHAFTAVLTEFKSQLHGHVEGIRKYYEASTPSKALEAANASLIETVKRHTQGSLCAPTECLSPLASANVLSLLPCSHQSVSGGVPCPVWG